VRALVVGSGPNGLAGALTFARAGLEVEVHEAASALGGGLRSDELTLPGFVHDLCSAIHPMGQSSPFFRSVGLDLEWVNPAGFVAHPFDDGSAVVLPRDLGSVDLGPDTRAYSRLVEPIVRAWEEVEPILLGPFPPPPAKLRPALRLGGALRAALADARSLADSTFAGERARAAFAGCAAHSILPLERRPSAGFGLALVVLGHVVGWGFPRGGAQALTDALVAQVRRRGGELRVSSPVDELNGKGQAGSLSLSADLVLADVMPAELRRIARLPERYDRALARYRHGPGAFKLDWALDGPIPWRAPEVAQAATVHLGGSLDEIAASEWGAWRGRPVDRPFVILAQHTLFDPTRAPEGKHTAWAYCHVPNGWRGDRTEAIESQVERFAPGFRDLVLARSAIAPADFERRNRNLVGGDVNGGTMDLGQLFTRPLWARNPYRTPVPGLYLCSSATPPGGGVHGMCGYSAALAALRDGSTRGRRPRSPTP
jgi:phytoene dehydrogenase-like protein